MNGIERKFNNEIIETINSLHSNVAEKFKEIILANE